VDEACSSIRRRSGIATRDQGFDPGGFSNEQSEAAKRAQTRQPGAATETRFYPPGDRGRADDPGLHSIALTTEQIAANNRRDWEQTRREPLVDPGAGRREAMTAGADRQRLYDAHWGRDAAGGRLMRHVVDLDPVEGGEGAFEGMNEAGERHELRRQGEGFSLWKEEPGADLQSIDARRQSSDCRCSDREFEVRKLAALQRSLDQHWSRGRIQ
jgi:hypothetical protein